MKMANIFSLFKNKWQKEIVPFPTELQDIQIVKITHLTSKKHTELGPKDIENFLTFMQKGRCNRMLKGATRYQISIQHENGISDYYIYGDSLGPEQGGLVQASFEPKKRGFEVFLHSFF